MVLLLFSGTFSNCVLLNAQPALSGCGTHATTADFHFLEEHVSSNYLNATQRMAGGIIEIPIQINIVCPGSTASTCFSETEVNNAINTLNTYFANVPMHFYECADRNYIYNVEGIIYDSNESEFTLCSSYDVSGAVNIYFVNRVLESDAIAYTSYTPIDGADRIIVATHQPSGDLVLYPNLNLAHEMAHFFGVYHTNGPGLPGSTDELVNGSNCATAGDKVCDTPADPADIAFMITNSTAENCQYPNPFMAYCCDANGDTYTPLDNNIMFPNYCIYGSFNAFTDEQYSRILQGYYGYRSYLSDAGDLVMRDNWYDVGQERNYLANDLLGWQDIWVSPDLWNCVNDPNCTIHEDPEYKASGNPNYLRVRITNRGCNPTPAGGLLNLYWTRARTGELWLNHWHSFTSNQTAEGYPLGHMITSSVTNPLMAVPIAIPPLDPGQEVILTQEWQAPNPQWYAGDGGFLEGTWPMLCFLARITGNPGFPDLIVGEETGEIGYNVLQSNNIVTRNCALVDIDPLNLTSIPKSILVENIEEQQALLDIRLTDVTRGNTASLLSYLNIYLLLDEQLWSNWQASGAKSEGIAYTNEPRTVQITNATEARLLQIPFESREKREIAVRFELIAPNGKTLQPVIPQTQYFSFYLWHSTNTKPESDGLLGGGIFEVAVHPKPIQSNTTESIDITCNPNPAQGNMVTVQFALPFAAEIQVSVYDVHGRLVLNPVQHQFYNKGVHNLPIQLQQLPAQGVYFCRISAGNATGICKIVLLR